MFKFFKISVLKNNITKEFPMTLDLEDCIKAIEICYNDQLENKCDNCPYHLRCSRYGKDSVINDAYFHLRQYKYLLEKIG